MMKMNWLFVVLIFSIFVTTIKSENTFTTYISVDGSDSEGTGSNDEPYASLRGAINAFNVAQDASSEPYTFFTINVKSGTYTGVDNINVDFPAVNITIQSEDSEENSVIFDCQFASPYGFETTAGCFQFYYITVQNCERGVNLLFPTTVDYQDVYIYRATFTNISQNAIWVQFPSSMSIQESTFSSPAGNAYSHYAYVVGNYSSGIDIISNSFTSGVGIYLENMNGGNIVGNNFINLTIPASGESYALYIRGGTWDIRENQFTNITSVQYSAVNLYYSENDENLPSFSLESNIFTNCVSQNYYGGAISFVRCLAQVTDSTFTSNSAVMGGAIFVSNSNLTVEESTFTSNNATRGGGAIDVGNGSFLFLYDNTFDSNYSNNTINALSCCTLGGANCATSVIVNENSEGDFTDINSCTFSYVSTDEYFGSLESYAYQEFTTPNGSSYWWVWLLVSFALVATILVVGIAAGVFIYTKKKRSYESFA